MLAKLYRTLYRDILHLKKLPALVYKSNQYVNVMLESNETGIWFLPLPKSTKVLQSVSLC